MVHGILSTTTDYGQATTVIIRVLPKIKSLDSGKKDEIIRSIMAAQLFVQEGSASLMEILRLAETKGKDEAINWAKQNLPPDYYERLEKLLFVFKMGKRYREKFTEKIPHIALHAGLRKLMVAEDLFSDPDKLISFLKNPINAPDVRFKKLIDVIEQNNFFVLKSPEELCNIAKINSYSDTTKKDVVNFLNYMSKLYGETHIVLEDEIREGLRGQEAIMKVNDNMLVANMNMNLGNRGEFLWSIADFLHYNDKFEAVIVSQFSEDLDCKKEVEKVVGRKHEVGIMGLIRDGNRYSIGVDYQNACHLINNDLADKTIIVKWGMYEPGLGHIKYMSGSRRPTVVIYNSVANLEPHFDNWLQDHKVEYLHLRVSDGHPFQTFIIKDSDGVFYLVNTFGNKHISEFIIKYKESLLRSSPAKFILDPKHFNNILSIWMGLSWNIDWFNSMIQQDDVVFRK
jgi:hypothetical protein